MSCVLQGEVGETRVDVGATRLLRVAPQLAKEVLHQAYGTR